MYSFRGCRVLFFDFFGREADEEEAGEDDDGDARGEVVPEVEEVEVEEEEEVDFFEEVFFEGVFAGDFDEGAVGFGSVMIVGREGELGGDAESHRSITEGVSVQAELDEGRKDKIDCFAVVFFDRFSEGFFGEDVGGVAVVFFERLSEGFPGVEVEFDGQRRLVRL